LRGLAGFTLNQATVGSQDDPAAAALAAGERYLAIWSDAATDTIEGRVISRDGTPASSQFTVNSTTGDTVYDPSIAGLLDGGAVVAYVHQTDDDKRIRRRLFDADGNPVANDSLRCTMRMDPRRLPPFLSKRRRRSPARVPR
jgi:hypothetical protein